VLSPEIPPNLWRDLLRQTYDNFEVILASDEGIVPAMNEALRKARGDIFVRIDDDVELPPKWLEEIAKGFSHPQIAGVTGPTFIPRPLRKNRDSISAAENPNCFLRWMFDGWAFAPAKIYDCGSVSYDSNFWERFSMLPYGYEPDHLEGTNWAMRTHLIKQVGGFDPKFDGVAEWFDDDVVFKIKKLGYRLAYNPAAYLHHMVSKGTHYQERFSGWGRIKNWLRFHWRHSKFHYKKVIWFMVMVTYFLTRNKNE
jgi:GT2 family glycosyltransferase